MSDAAEIIIKDIIGLKNTSLKKKRGFTTEDLITMEEAGLKPEVFDKIQDIMGISQVELADILSLNTRSLDRYKKNKKKFGKAQTGSILRLSETIAKTTELFDGDIKTAIHWLLTPARGLGGKKPVEYLSTVSGTKMVRELIDQIYWGILA